ncbi:MAG TPA: hypothetical protein VJT77_03820 [Burkholderiales bacterium]|nr:hypothetical protein [Burkholderiales bacterium]
MSEPTTLLTDYALGAVSLLLGIKLIRDSRLWTLAFLALSLAAFLGGTWHGLWQSDPLWKATTLSVGVASFGMVAGSAHLTTTGALKRLLLIFAALKWLLFTLWMLRHDDFIWVVADTGVALALVGLLHLWRFNGWMLAGVAVSLLAGLAQASGVTLHPRFNHNDLYHVIQIAAMFLFYRGLKKASERASML